MMGWRNFGFCACVCFVYWVVILALGGLGPMTVWFLAEFVLFF